VTFFIFSIWPVDEAFNIIFVFYSRLSAAGPRGWLPAAAFVFALHWRSGVQEWLPAMASKNKSRLQSTLTTIVLKTR